MTLSDSERDFLRLNARDLRSPVLSALRGRDVRCTRPGYECRVIIFLSGKHIVASSAISYPVLLPLTLCANYNQYVKISTSLNVNVTTLTIVYVHAVESEVKPTHRQTRDRRALDERWPSHSACSLYNIHVSTGSTALATAPSAPDDSGNTEWSDRIPFDPLAGGVE